MKETSKFRERYNRWKNGENYWEIRADLDLPKFQSGKDNQSYSDWKTKASTYKGIRIDEDDEYDYEGWYNEDPNRAYDFLNDAPGAHFTDKYKTVKHPTFSNLSIYSGHVNKFNPTGTTGGTWIGNSMYIPHKTQIQDKTINYKRTRDYLNHNEESFVAMPKFKGGKDGETNSFDPFGIISIPINKIRERAYKTINPLEGYNIPQHGKAFLAGDSLVYTGNELVEFLDGNAPIQIVDDIWANYLLIPESKRRYDARIQQSLYKPSSGNKDVEYYKLPLIQREKDRLVRATNNLNIGQNIVSEVLSNYNLANHTVGRGYDTKGEYRSYYDRWDINPFNGKYNGWNIKGLNKLGDASFGIGKPVNIYDRIYMDDYYESPVATHATYLPEIIINGVDKTKKPSQLKPNQ